MLRLMQLAAIGSAAFALCTAPALATRYASPTGSDTASCADGLHLCSLKTAIEGHGSNHPATGEQVIVNSGVYEISAPIVPGAVNLTVQGVRTDGLPPILTWSGTGDAGVAIDASSDAISLSDLDFSAQQVPASGSTAVVDVGGTLDRLFFDAQAVPSSGFVCACTGGVLRDSVVYNWGIPGGHGIVGYRGHGLANETTGTPIVEDLRNDTILSDDAAIPAIGLDTTGTDVRASVKFTAENVIAETIDPLTQQPYATGLGAKLERSDPSGTESLRLTNSDVIGQDPEDGATIGVVSGNISAPPILKNFPADPEQAPGSPTIDAGLDDLLDGPLDVKGVARTQGAHTDIGAYEFPSPAPLIAGLAPVVTLLPPSPLPFAIARPKLKLYTSEEVILANVTRDGSVYGRCTGVTLTCKVSGKLRTTLPGQHHVSTIGTITGSLKANHKALLKLKLTLTGYLAVYHSTHRHRTVSVSVTTTAGLAKTIQTFSIALQAITDYSSKHGHGGVKQKHRGR